jgi:hypothetical protein
VRSLGAQARLHLHDHELRARSGHEVQLAARVTKVSGEDKVPESAQVKSGEALTGPAALGTFGRHAEREPRGGAQEELEEERARVGHV